MTASERMKLTLFPFASVVSIAIGLAVGSANPVLAAQTRAIGAEDGTVVACFGPDIFIFADKCSGPVALEYVSPIKDGPIVWQTATGSVGRDSEDTCSVQTIAVATPATEVLVGSDREIRVLDPNDKALKELVFAGYTGGGKGEAEVKAAFSVDLNGTGDLIAFIADDAQSASDKFEADHVPTKYTIVGRLFKKGWGTAVTFYYESGIYSGGTDAIGRVDFVGLTRLDPSSKEISIVLDTGNLFSRSREIYRFASGGMFSIKTPDVSCM